VSLNQQSYLGSIIPQRHLAPYRLIRIEGAHLSFNPPKIIDTDQYDLVLLVRSWSAIMATPSAAFDMADFVDFGEASMPNVSQETDHSVSGTLLQQR